MSTTVDPRIRWGIPSAVIVLVVFAGVITSGLLVTGPVLRATGADPSAVSFWATVALDGIVVLACWIVVRARGTGSLASDLGLRFRPIDLALGPGAGIAAKILAVLVLAIVLVATRADLTQLGSNVPFDRSSVWSWLLLGIVGCVLAPVAEELLFRGLVLRAVQRSVLRRGPDADPSRRRRVAAAIAAVAVSSVLFAGFHLYEATSPLMLGVLGGQILLLGVVHGVLTVVTGRLGPAILSHVANNAIAFALLAAVPQLGSLTR